VHLHQVLGVSDPDLWVWESHSTQLQGTTLNSYELRLYGSVRRFVLIGCSCAQIDSEREFCPSDRQNVLGVKVPFVSAALDP
jgi:hypothetical protein